MKTLIAFLLLTFSIGSFANNESFMDRLSSQIIGPDIKRGEPDVPVSTSRFNYCLKPDALQQSDLNPANSLTMKGKVDYILVSKERSELYLLSGNKILKTYKISFGFNKLGHKFREGDGRTPEGVYTIEYKNDQSSYHLSLKVSYPSNTDKKRSEAAGFSPGGAVMIHGLPNDPNKKMILSKIQGIVDWTEGCLAVNDEEIEEIFAVVKTGTVIEICPLP